MARFITQEDFDAGFGVPADSARSGRPPTVADVREQAKAKGIDPDLAASLVQQESGGNPRVRNSDKGAVGLMQVIPDTFKMVMGDRGDINDAWDNLEAGLRYIQYGQKKLGNDPKLLAAGYHQGYDRPELQRGEIANTSDGRVRTPDYAASVVARMGVRGAPRGRPETAGQWVRSADLEKGAANQPDVAEDDAYRWERSRPIPDGAVSAGGKGVSAASNLYDLGKLLKVGANVAAQDVRELTRRIPIVGESVVGALDKVDQFFSGKGSDTLLKEDTEAMTAGAADKMQQALQKKWWDSDRGSFGDAWLDWRSYAGGLMQSLPEQALTMVPAMRLAKAAYASKIAAGATAEAAGLSAARTAAVSGGVLEGALGGAQASRSVRDDILKMSEADLKDSDAFKGLMAQGMSFSEARKQVADDAATQAFFLAGVATGVFGGLGDRVLAKAMVGQMKGGVAGRVFKGAVGEGVLEEFPQSAGQQLAQNYAMRQAKPGQPLEEEVLNQAFGGLAIGGVQGGIQTGVFGRRGERAGQAGSSASGLASRGINLASDTGAVPARDIFGGPAVSSSAPPARAPADAAAQKALEPIALDAAARVEEIDQRLATVEDAAERSKLTEERAALAKDFPDIQSGAETTFQTESGADLQARYGLVEADAAVTSHDENLRPNPAYPQQLQPRERDRAASEVQVSSISQRLNPARLGESADAANGAPIMGVDGIVESGNARTIALKRVYQAGGAKAGEYRTWLAENAAKFGLTPEQVQGMQDPVLVRVRTTPVNRAEFARQANAPTTATMSPVEQARSDAARLDTIDDLVVDDRGDIPRARNSGFIKRFVSGLPITEQSALITATGELSQSGVARIRNAILGKAYGDSPALLRLVESMDNNLRNITSALMRVAPQVAKARDAIKAGALHDADITAELLAAVEELSRIREIGQTVAGVLAQSEMFGMTLSPEAVDLLQFLDANMRYPNKVAQFIQNYLTALGAAGNPSQASLLGESTAPAKADIIKAAKGGIDGTTAEVRGREAAAPEAAAAGAPGSSSAGKEAGAGGAETRAAGEQERPGEGGDQGGVGEDAVAAKSEFDAALSELGEWVEQRVPKAAMTSDAEKKTLLPILSQLFAAAAKLGYVKFKDALAHVLKGINASDRLRELTAWLDEADYREAFDTARAAPQALTVLPGVPVVGDFVAWDRYGKEVVGEVIRASTADGLTVKVARSADRAVKVGAVFQQRPDNVRIVDYKASPIRAANASDTGGASITSPSVSLGLADGSHDLVPRSKTSMRPEPSSSSTIRAIPKSVSEGHARTFKVGDIDGTSGRIVFQSTDDVDALFALAEASRPELDESLHTIAESLGATVTPARTKGRARLQEKMDEGRPAFVITDYLGARMAVGSTRGIEDARAALRKRYRVLEEDDFLSKPKKGYRAVHVQVVLDSGLSAEVQIVPLAVNQAQEVTHDVYAELRTVKKLTPDQVAEKAAMEEMFDESWEDFQAGRPWRGPPESGNIRSEKTDGEQQSQRADVPAPGGEAGDAGGGAKSGPAKPVDRGQMGLDFAAAPERTGSEKPSPPAPEGTSGRGSGSDLGREGGGQELGRAGQRVAGAGGDRPGPVTGPTDYTITDVDALGAGGAKTKARGNIAAIRLLKALESDKRLATPEEQAVLVKYVGWGGIKQIFDEKNTEWVKEREDLRALLDDDSYAAARRSVLDSHFTSKPVVEAIYSALARMGFNGGAVLEPAGGIGHFIGLMPGDVRAYSRITAVELDPTTGGIAKQLYQKSDIISGKGFQDVKVREGWYDAVVGNPPFGETRVFDQAHQDISKFSLHNFFFAKSVLSLRPGGVLGMVVSNFMLDAYKYDARAWLAQHAELIGAIRLPNTAFKANAGTEVTTDIVFLKKLVKPLTANEAKDVPWVKTSTVPDAKTGKAITLNEYFVRHPEMMLGKMTLGGSMYAGESAALEPIPGQDLAKALAEAIARLPRNVYLPGTRSIEELTNVDGMVPDGVKVGGYFVLPDGQIGIRLGDVEDKRRSTLAPLKDKTRDRVRGLIGLRDAMNKLMRAELSGDSDGRIRNLRDDLNRAYDGFQRKFGNINDVANRRAFDKDPDAPRVEALEKDYDPGLSKGLAARDGVEPRRPTAKKADIFTKSTQAPRTEITKVENVKDALSASLGEKGRIDFDYMQEISGRDKEAIKAELAGVIYKNPEGAWEPVDQYLSGNVKAKLAIARKAAASDPAYQGNVDALEKVQPADIEAVDISVRLDSPWVPPEDVADFIESILKAKPTSLHYTAAVAKWFLTMAHGSSNEIRTMWGAITEDERGGRHGWDAIDIIGSVLNQTPILVRENQGTKDEPHWVTLDAETRLAQQKAEDIRIKFNAWLWEDAARRERLVRKYNDTYNTNVVRVFDGTHLSLPGTNPAIQLTPNKKHAVWRMVQDKAVLLDHVVGSGKTFTTAAGFMELRRLGLMKKGIVVVPNHLVKQWRDEWYALYPNANVLAATEQDFDKENRQRLFSRIATGDWDAVIVPHTSFTKIGMPPDVQQEILMEQINDLTDAIEELKSQQKGRDPSVRQMEKVRERMKERVDRLSQTGAKDQAVTFEELGVDGLAVDEAHLFKNLFYYSQMRGVAGLGDPSGSQRAFDLFVKVRYLNRINGRTIFATGTPVSNSLVEMFTMQRYMSYDDLKARGVHHLDSWAGVYGNITQVWEIDPSGQGSRLATRFAKFVNLPELMTSYRTFADVLTMTDLQEQFQANEGRRYPVPRIKGSKPENFVAERSPGQSEFFGVQEPVLDDDGNPELDDKGRPRKVWNEGSILHRIENMPKDPHEDNMLKVTNDARFAGLDLRTMLPGTPDFKASKINTAVANIVRIYKAWGEDKGAQMVFLDLSKPSGKKASKAAPSPVAPAEGAEPEDAPTISMDELLAERVKFSVYDDVKAKLIAAGIPEREIAFIHDANTSEQKRTLFGKVNRGEVRILMGSTAKMGAGTNAQRRLVAMHHLDAPWRPSDLEQREGRIIRRGNALYDRDPDGFEVEIIRYATKQTYDTRMWQLLEHKARAIEQIRRGTITSRTTEDVDGEAANAAEMKAAASGNPLIMEEIKLRTNGQKLEGLEQASKRQQFALESQARRLEGAPQRVQEAKNHYAPFIAARQAKPEEGFVYTAPDGSKIT